ncbi:unnamed protein product [Darwinula stevensoni]|uniref:Uncharacterized protein n=1 Tax=Darwinula stevensoni TaxID=69355 RepID=A0A7R9A0K3_9CRUS|nr:unnamed protein product [Darwinula stevensoni]CAG0881347.1 unnamed protein product [Darwinula stevensoni]
MNLPGMMFHRGFVPGFMLVRPILQPRAFSRSFCNCARLQRPFLHVLGKNLPSVRRHVTVAVSKMAPELAPKAREAVGLWLFGCSGLVLGAVVLGGLTRLTESGLSMVDWHLWKERPPMSQRQWVEEFDKYKQFPEFQMKNQDMSLEEFKFIWWMEYIHRMWGRGIGLAFLLPAVWFWKKKYFTSSMKKRVVAYGSLILAQGLMGWYMVKSGLEEERFQGQSDVPRVSQYRLAAHLSLAFVLYTLFFWAGLDHVAPAQGVASISRSLVRFRAASHAVKGLVFLTAVSGAFVAGLDAGLVYNSFPKMADRWIPSDLLAMSPTAKNFTENATTVQFDHRILGTLSLASVTGLWFASRRLQLPGKARAAATTLLAVGWSQVILGIHTLILFVPTWCASLHQLGSLLTISSAVWLTHELKWVKKFPVK